jgi:hypothetical protein
MTLAVRHKDDARETSAERQCPTPLCFRRTAQIGNPEPSSPGFLSGSLKGRCQRSMPTVMLRAVNSLKLFISANSFWNAGSFANPSIALPYTDQLE